MKREDIEEKYTWDLSKIYPSTEAFESDFNAIQKEMDKIPNYQGNFTKNPTLFLDFMKLYEKVDRTISKLYEYAHLAMDVEPEDAEIQEKYAKAMSLYTKLQKDTVFVDLEILENSDKVVTFLEDDNLKEYTHYIQSILRSKPHVLNKEEENLLALANDALDSSYETYFSFRPDFKPVIIDGKEHFLNYAMLLEYLKSDKEDVRRQAYENYYGEYRHYANIFANTLAGQIKKDVFYAKARKFASPLEASIFEDNAPKELFDKILYMANDKYHSYLLDYTKLRKKILKKEKLELYDMQVPLVKTPDQKYTLEDAFSLIYKATKNFGKEYHSILEKAKDERWIDYMPHQGKAQGAYSSGVYDTNPYILMSYTNDLESVFTLIHELGHSVHTYFSTNNQPYINHNYRIFVAEFASTVNENLLMNLLLKTASSKEEKLFLLYRMIEETIGLMYRQPFFANFENILHERVSQDESLSNPYMTSLYEKLTKEYWGPDVKIHDLAGYSCYSVPHFYYNYYVYKYTLGHAVSSVIADRIANGDKGQTNKYLNFLKSGSSKDPIELLKEAGVDPLSDEIYDLAYTNFKKHIDEFKSIIKN